MPKKGVYQKATFVALLIILMNCNFFGTAFAEPFSAPSTNVSGIVERPEEELLILELRINQNVRNRGFLAYLPDTSDTAQTLIPLQVLSKDMSIAITADPGEGIAQGWFLEEKNVFQLDLDRRIVLTGGKEEPLPAGAAEAHYDDIYVRADLLEKWFNLKIRVDLSTLRIDINSSSPLPYEAELEREKRAALLRKKSLTQQPPYDPSQFLPYKKLGFPSVILQDTVQLRHTPSDNILQNNYSIQSFSDLGGFGTRFLLSGDINNQDGHEIQSARLTFRKRDPARGLLGRLKAGSIAFGDVDYPDVPLFAGRRNGFGASMSSNPQLAVSRSFGPETTIIDGDAPIGWDAELYRNGNFIDFQEINAEGRYSFEDVELIKGFNLFKIILYGPEGQKQTQTQRIVRGAEMLSEGEVSYEFAIGQPEADFLPIAEDSNTDRSFGTSGQIFYGLKKYLTIGASVFSGTDRTSTINSSQNAATVSAIVPFLGFRNQFRLLRASEGRSGYDVETSTQIAGANISLGHTVYDGFDENDQELKQNTTFAINRKIGRFSASLQAENRKFLDEADEQFIRNSLSTRFLGVQLTNTLEKTFSKSESQENFDGDLAILSDLWDWRLRSNILYDLDDRTDDTLQNIRVSAIRKINTESSIRVNADHSVTSDVTSTDIRYSRQFDVFSVDWNVGASSDNNYFTGMTVRTALQPDHENKYSFVNAREGGLGSVGLRTYLDANDNGQYDEGETLLEGIGFRSNRGVVDEKTDENGMVFIRGLSESATRFSLDETTLPSIYLKPKTDFVDIFPRRGATTSIDMGFSQLGEIDGFIYKAEKDENGEPIPAPGISVQLIDLNTGEEIDEIRTEYDGYYIFTPLELGAYRVKTLPAWSEDPASLPTIDVLLNSERAIQMDQNLTLPAILLRREEKILEDAKIVEISTQNTSGYFIQIGSYKKHTSAESEKNRAAALSPDKIFDIHSVQIGQVTYHRVVSPVETYKDGQALCRSLKKSGIIDACVVIIQP